MVNQGQNTALNKVARLYLAIQMKLLALGEHICLSMVGRCYSLMISTNLVHSRVAYFRLGSGRFIRM